MTAPAGLSRRRRRGGAFSPQVLFANGEPGVWYDPSDFSTLFQDSVGTTPVTALGQPVGLMLDKSRGALNAIGPELVVNGNYANGTANWTPTLVTLAVVNGELELTDTSASSSTRAVQSFTTVVGSTYRITGSSRNGTATSCVIRVGTTSGGSEVFAQSTPGVLNRYFVATATTTFVSFVTAGTDPIGSTGYFGPISVREVPGVHAVQGTLSARPTVQARSNLLTNTIFSGGVSGSPGTAPTGWSGYFLDAADTFTYSGGEVTVTSARGYVGQELSVVSGAAWTFSGEVFVSSNPDNVSLTQMFAVLGLVAGTSTLRVNGISQALSYAPPLNQWLTVAITRTFSASGTERFGLGGGVPGPSSSATTAVFRRPQVEQSATATTYQRVTTATDYADIGLPRYLQFDGSDDAMVTAANLNLTSTDKVSVFAGLRKLTDSATGLVAELSNNAGGNDGAFAVFASIDALPRYASISRGTTNQFAFSLNNFPAPETRVLTHISNISGDSVILRINSAVAAQNTNDQGTGNYGTYPLFIGSRNQASLRFNGFLHQLIVRGALSDATTIQQAERFVGQKTGVVIP